MRMGTANTGNTTLKKRKRTTDPMLAYDRLPADLRIWLSQAALPWSPHSALRAWRRALHTCGGNSKLAKLKMTRAEQRQMVKDVRKIWGCHHPAAQDIS